MPRSYHFFNPHKVELSHELKKVSKEKKAKIWGVVADKLGQGEINLNKINRYSKDNETVVIPGKVLGCGRLEHKVKVAAFKFSPTAEKKIRTAGGEISTINDLVKKNPGGSGVRILS